ncbi:MAG: GHMP kinase [Nanoarchaeota archaeon]|nr:GHMP kinase [Nanoarchaeota archaeon]
MIISKTPLRVSFTGGGTDLKAFYGQEFGAVTSTAIDKYIYVTVNKRFEKGFRISYSQTEIVNRLEDIKHELVREACRLVGIEGGIEVTTIADIPSKGTGLGSSSTVTVGLLNALYAFQGQHKSAEELAKEACKIEIDILKKPIGKQDQYIAAYGGFQHIRFNPDESVFVDPIICSKNIKEELQKNIISFYTGTTRSANEILSEQRNNTHQTKKFEALKKMRDLAIETKETLNKNDLTRFGECLHKNWTYKKELALGITSPLIEKYYDSALKSGALGGKICGAGGGGFMLIYAEQNKHDKIKNALKALKEFKLGLEPQGSKIIYVGD